MNIEPLLQRVKARPDFSRAGMVLIHNGVVRATSRDGRKVTGLRVSVDHERLAAVISSARKKPGIVAVEAEISENQDLAVGDDVMVLIVAGDVRENVLAVLSQTLDAIKTTVTGKTEFFL